MLKLYRSIAANGLPVSQLDFSGKGINGETKPLLGQPQQPGAPPVRRRARFGPPPGSSFAGPASACLYGAVAVAMNFINRYTLLAFPMPTAVLMLQMLATVAILHPLLLAGKLDFPHFCWRRCRQLLLISVLYTGNTAFALFGLKTLNVPMYSTLKRLTPMIVLVCKSITSRRFPQPAVISSVALVVLGCIVAGCGDLSFNLLGYAFALLSCTAQSAYLLLVEYQGGGGCSTSELLYYNAISSIPLLGAIMLANGDATALWPALAHGAAKHGVLHFYSMVVTCSVCGCLLNYSLFLCTMHNSALTTTIVGVLKGVVAVGLGFVLDTVRISPLNVAGVSLNMAGGMWYTLHKFRSRQRGVRRSILASASADPLSILAAMEDGSGKRLAQLQQAMANGAPHPALDGGGAGVNGLHVAVGAGQEEDTVVQGQNHGMLSPHRRHVAERHEEPG